MNDTAETGTPAEAPPRPYEMPKPKFTPTQMVKIDGSGLSGMVTSVWIDVHSETSYRVRYYDGNKVKQEQWFYAAELTAL